MIQEFYFLLNIVLTTILMQSRAYLWGYWASSLELQNKVSSGSYEAQQMVGCELPRHCLGRSFSKIPNLLMSLGYQHTSTEKWLRNAAPLASLLNECIPKCFKACKDSAYPQQGRFRQSRELDAILPVLGKIFEVIMKRQLGDYLKKDVILSSGQHEFGRGHLTVTAQASLNWEKSTRCLKTVSPSWWQCATSAKHLM